MKKCKIDNCDGKHYGKGYCQKHYMQYKRYGCIIRTHRDPNEIVIYDDYAEIVIYDKDCEEIARALINLEDIDKVSKYKWHLNNDGYVVNKKVGSLHRFITDCPSDKVIDHKNNNPLDNRRCNIRICTIQQNSMNMSKHKNSSSQYKGVSWKQQNKKWCVQIKGRHIGLYESEEEGAIAYDKAAIKYFGVYAKTNFPIENYTNYIINLGLDINDFNK